MFRNFLEMLRRDRFLLILLIVFILEGPLMELMTGGASGLINWFMDTLLVIPAIMIGLSFHEFGHAKAAQMCGDNTPLYQGRVTLDPRAHIDPMGLISLVFLGFGWGRPVQINPLNFRDRRRDGLIVGLAGVTMNLIVALTVSLVLRFLIAQSAFVYSTVGGIVIEMLFNIVSINIYLMLFNLLPIPPLDGYGVVGDLFGLRNSAFYKTLYYNSRYILMMMLVLRLPSRLLSPIYSLIIRGVINHIIY
ncbi:MAG: site-2 protease family protein [Firmicutes bacterium]|nr:site-2 protease family protein [Bacillota bacterium]